MGKVYNRAGEGSKRRALRNSMPKAEVVLWSRLKGKGLNGYKFRRQHGIGSYVVDFYCPELKIAIEVDGDSHFMDGAARYDKEREEFINRHGVAVLRFTNEDVLASIEGVLEKISELLHDRPPLMSPPW